MIMILVQLCTEVYPSATLIIAFGVPCLAGVSRMPDYDARQRGASSAVSAGTHETHGKT
jgi:hypothetical protein